MARKNYYNKKIALYEKELQLKAERNYILKRTANIEKEKLKSLEERVNFVVPVRFSPSYQFNYKKAFYFKNFCDQLLF